MSSFELATLFLSAVAIGAWLNARTARLPHGVAMMFVGVAGAMQVDLPLPWALGVPAGPQRRLILVAACAVAAFSAAAQGLTFGPLTRARPLRGSL